MSARPMVEPICSQTRCGRIAVVRYQWPGSGELLCCVDCYKRVSLTGEALGLGLLFQSIPVDYVERMHGAQLPTKLKGRPRFRSFPELSAAVDEMWDRLAALELKVGVR